MRSSAAPHPWNCGNSSVAFVAIVSGTPASCSGGSSCGANGAAKPGLAEVGFVAYFALKHPQDDVKQLIEHALGRMGYVSLAEGEETRAHVLVLEPASAPHLEAARRLRELCPELPIVCVSVLPPFPEVLELRLAAYLVKPFTIAGLRATIETVLNPARAASRAEPTLGSAVRAPAGSLTDDEPAEITAGCPECAKTQVGSD